MSKNKSKYIHDESVHNLLAPTAIVNEIMRLINPKSVLDIGCGIGTFLHCFKKSGLTDVLGIDGEWVNKEILNKYILPDEFLEMDLEETFYLERKFDLVICLEVAEHISESASDKLINNIINAGKVVLFSAPIPFQGGQNHINEQWLDFWVKKFSKHKYILHDVLKPMLWNNPDIFFWYKQNIVLFTSRDYKFQIEFELNKLKNIIHQDLYLNKVNEINAIRTGSMSKSFYLKLSLKSIIGHENSQRIKHFFQNF